ncbi:MAG: [FeFe] hydrogenase H-cluster radical SAM maturase HydE [Candidatus Omnitrophota bacterium]|jgi:biotin synthase
MFNAVGGLQDTLNRVYEKPGESFNEIKRLLLLEDEKELEVLFSFADKVRKKFVGEGVLLRGLVEFSNNCANSCFYCGLNKQNSCIKRYRMTKDEIMRAVDDLSAMNIKTVVLQSGEDSELEPLWLAGIIKEIKNNFGLAITLSAGEKPHDAYKLWRDAGADRYLLKIETTDLQVYAAAHSGRFIESRLKCLDDLISLRYQVGSGVLVGLRGQTADSLARDILFFKDKNFDMIGIGPFIPHTGTFFSNDKPGDIRLTLKVIALTRIITRDAHLPATTALGSVGTDYRIEGLKSGANVLMPNFTPPQYKALYEIYPGKACIKEASEKCVLCMDEKAKISGRFLDYSAGHSIKKRYLFN